MDIERVEKLIDFYRILHNTPGEYVRSQRVANAIEKELGIVKKGNKNESPAVPAYWGE